MKNFAFIAILMSLLPAIGFAQATQPDHSSFGCWAQDAGALKTWAARGVTFAVGGPQPGGTTVAAYYAAARDAGLRVMLASDLQDRTQGNAWGTLLPDEVETWSYFNFGPAGVPAWLTKYKAQAAPPAAHPIFGNITANIQYAPASTATANQPFTLANYADAFSVCDITGMDYYSRNGNHPVSSWPGDVAPAIAKMVQASGGKPFDFFIETSCQNPGKAPGPTADECVAEAGLAYIHGAHSIIWFSHQFADAPAGESIDPNCGPVAKGGCDGTPPGVAKAITDLANLVKANQPIFDAASGPVQKTENVYWCIRGGGVLAVNLGDAVQFRGRTLTPLQFAVFPPSASAAPAAQRSHDDQKHK